MFIITATTPTGTETRYATTYPMAARHFEMLWTNQGFSSSVSLIDPTGRVIDTQTGPRPW